MRGEKSGYDEKKGLKHKSLNVCQAIGANKGEIKIVFFIMIEMLP